MKLFCCEDYSTLLMWVNAFRLIKVILTRLGKDYYFPFKARAATKSKLHSNEYQTTEEVILLLLLQYYNNITITEQVHET